MERFSLTINCSEIKRNAIVKAKELAGKDIAKAIKLAKRFYKQMLELTMCPRVDCKQLLNAA